MNTLMVKSRWNIAIGKLKQKLARIAADEVQFTEGKEEELVGLIQKRKAEEIAGTVPPIESCCACHCQPK